jgi:hypothetical protein
MRRLLFAAALLVPLAGCQTIAGWVGGTPSQQTKTTLTEAIVDACKAYATTLNLAADAEDAKLLSQAQVTQIDNARGGANSLCQGQQPTNLASALVAVTTATAQIAAAYTGAH